MIDLELRSKIDEELHDLHNSEQLRTKAADDSGFSFTPIEDGKEPDVDLKVAPEGFSFTPIEDDFDPWKIKPQHIFSVDGKNTNAAEKMDIVEKSWVKKFAESDLGKFGNTMFQSSARGIFETLKGFGDMATFYGDNMIISKDSQELLGLSDATVNRLNSFGRLWQSAGEKIKQAGDFVLSSPELQLDEEIFEGDIVENPSVTRFASAAMSAAPSLLFMTRIAAATKSPALAYYLMAGSESGDLYAEARNTGDQNKANLLFTGSVAGTALIDFVFKPLDAIMGKTSSSSLKSKVFQRIKAGFLEGMPESLQQVWQNFVRKYGIDDTQNLMEGVIESAIGGFGAGAALAGAYQYADAREGLKNKGASDEEINRLIDASTYVLENHADAANDAAFQHINERLDNLNKFIEENKGTAEAQKALQTKQELESIYDDVFNALKDKTGENNAAASARIWQGFALFASQETGMSPKEYITDYMPKIVKMNYNDFNSQTQRYRTRNANENWANIVRDIKAARGKKVADDRMTLTEFLVSRGGIKDEGGELSALDAVVAADMGKKGKRLKREEKRLVREDGLSLDYAREAAAEAGYLPADADVNALLSALDDEFRGRPHYLLTETNSAAIDEREALRNYEMAFEAAGVDIEADSPDTIRRKMDAYAARKKEDEVLAKVGLLSDDLQERYFILRENDVNAEEAYAEVMRENGDLATLVDDDIPFQYQTGEALTERENGYKIADDNETVETVVIPDNALPEFKTRADLRNWLIGKFNEIGNVTIKSTGANVEFNKTGAQRAIKNARQKKNNIAYPEIEKVVSGAKYSGFREADERHQNVKGQDVYHSGVVYKGVPYSVEFYVDVPLSGNTGDNFAGNKIREIKIAPTETRVTSENQNRPANNLSDAISNVSLAVLRGKVKPARYDAETGVLYQTGAEFGWPDYREIEASEPYIGYKKYAEDVRNMIQDDVKYADLQMSVNRVGGISSYINGETKDGEAFRIRISDHDTNYDTADISFYYSSDKNKFIERWQKFLKQSEQRKAKAEKQEAARKEYIAENLPKEYINYYRQYGLKALKKAVNERQLPPFKFTFNDEQQKIYGTRGISWRDVKQFIEENSEPVNDTLYQTGEPLTEYAYEKGGRAYNKQQLKENQFEVIKEKNPAPNKYQTWIRNVEDIKTFDEVIDDDESFVWGDYTREDALRDLERGEVTVYSSNDIIDGNFVSTSYRQALDYAGGDAKNVREATLPLAYIAWINGDEGQVAITSTIKKRLEKTYFQTGNGSDMLNLEVTPVRRQGEDRINSVPKGAYSPQMNVIYLFENADASTFMHESSHFFKKQLKYFAGKSEKSAQLLKAVEDWENSEFDRQFVIDEKDGDFRVLDKNGIIIHEGFKSADLARNYAKEELFARGFEQFLREGKAPSNYLKRVFDMFLNWLRRIYTTAKEMRVKINKDISAVYGDILGGEDLDYYLQAPIDEVVNYNREKAIEERRKMDEVYKAANRDYIAGKSKFQKTVQQILKDAKDFTQDAIVPLEEVVKSISPELWTKNRRLEIAKLQKNSQYAKRVKGFFDKAQKLMPEVFNKLDLALKNRDVETVAGILSENDMTNDFIEVRKVLDELREQMIEVGVEINYLPDYFPRKLRDADGLLDYLRQKYEGKPEYSKIMQVLEEKSKDGRIRSEEDRAQIVNSLFRGYGGTISLANVGNAKERSIDLIDAEMNKYYKNSVDALVDYVSGAINLTENKKYFGKEAEDVQILRRRVSNRKTTIAEYEKMDAKEAKWKEIKTRNYKIGAVDAQIRNTYDDLLRQDLEERKARLETEVEFLKNRKAEQVKEIALRRMNEELKTLEDELSEKADNTIEESVGNLLYDLAKDGVITHTQEMRLKELLVARFSNKGLGNEFLRMLRDGGYIWTLGNVGSAITQFGDLGSAVYKAGFWNTMFENVKAWQGKSEITLEDLGLNKVITDGGYVDTSKLTKHLDKVLKYTGFEKIDGISKMTLVNAAVNKARRDAQAGSKELEEYLRVEFGNRWKEVANDLKEGRKTPEIIEYAMFQLMDVQPVTIDQMPKFYAEGGKKRMFYMMKSYFIKQLNEYRKICFETAKTNPQKALVDLMRLTLWLMLFNAGSDFLKDLLFGREIDVTDTLLENVFVGGSINRYTGMSIKRDGLFKTIQDQLAFPVIFDEIIKDVLSNRDVADYKSWRNVPLIGNPYYYWFGGGSK